MAAGRRKDNLTPKQGTANPIRLQDLAIITNTALDTNPVLLERFRAHDRVVHDPNTDLYTYRVCHDWVHAVWT